jgi:protein AroM
MKRTIALLSIGRSPRPDIRRDVETDLRSEIALVERGALDGLSDEEVRAIAPLSDDDALLASLGNGREAIVSKNVIGNLLQKEIRTLESEVDGFAILCTGIFSGLTSARVIGQVGKLLLEAGAACDPGRAIGVLVPIREQCDLNERLWSAGGRPVVTATASPYGGIGPVLDAARGLKARGASVIAMSCMTYSEEMRAAVCAATEAPTIGPGQVLVEFINKEWNE